MAKLNIPHLHQRGKVFYFLIAVPKNRRAEVGRSQIWISLHTSDKTEAIEKVEILRKKYQTLFELNRPLTPTDVIESTKPKAVAKMQADLGMPPRHFTDFVNSPLFESF
ncbi:MAG: hypothetical protein KIS86_18895, partial [Devosia sp.]|nr:hypothetical protein [Devosia sp.]